MKKIFYFFIFFNSFIYADISNQQLIGKWKVTEYLTSLSVGNLSQEDIDSIPGQTLEIGPENITLQTKALYPDDRSCAIDNTDSGWITRDPYDYFVTDNDYFLSQEDVASLELHAPFWTLDSDCIQVFTKNNPNTIVFMFASGFFEAVRIANS